MLTLLNLLSAVALLIWGTHIVRSGILRVYGSHLRKVLSHNVSKQPLAFAAGIGVTALVQSSNATALLVTSFVAQGLMALAPALAIMLGADVGTALMARVLTFDLSWLSPLLIFLGVIFFLSRKQTRAGQLGRVAIGLGLMLLALELIVAAATPITQEQGIRVLFASLTGDLLLDALVGALFALISYSSLAAVLLTATLTGAGLISLGGHRPGDWRQYRQRRAGLSHQQPANPSRAARGPGQPAVQTDRPAAGDAVSRSAGQLARDRKSVV